jgi:protein tyrosine/serine phosphatase
MIELIVYNGIRKWKMNIDKDNEITNFREVCMGNISSGLLFRGSHPFYYKDTETRNAYDKLVSDTKIKCVINLADNQSRLETTANSVPWYHELLKNDHIIVLDIYFTFNFNNKFENEIFKYKLKQCFLFMIEHNGPYLIHCNAGADRTGFVIAIIEGLLGAGTDEILYDYLLSYGKDFADEKTKENKTAGKVILRQLDAITNGKLNDKNNLQSNIEGYFLKEIGLSKKELELLKEKLTKII